MTWKACSNADGWAPTPGGLLTQWNGDGAQEWAFLIIPGCAAVTVRKSHFENHWSTTVALILAAQQSHLGDFYEIAVLEPCLPTLVSFDLTQIRTGCHCPTSLWLGFFQGTQPRQAGAIT